MEKLRSYITEQFERVRDPDKSINTPFLWAVTLLWLGFVAVVILKWRIGFAP